MVSDVQIAGLSELNDLLAQLPVQIEKKLLRGALRAGQKVVANKAKEILVSNESASTNDKKKVLGALAASIKVSARMRGSKVSATVKAGDKTAFYSHMVEFGTKAHFIGPKVGKDIAFNGVVRKGINHPGAKKKPFMRPAMDANAQEGSAAFNAVKAYLEGKITKELDKLPDETDGAA